MQVLQPPELCSMLFRENPIVRVALLFTAGICFSWFVPQADLMILGTIALLSGLGVWFAGKMVRKNSELLWIRIQGVLFCISILTASAAVFNFRMPAPVQAIPNNSIALVLEKGSETPKGMVHKIEFQGRPFSVFTKQKKQYLQGTYISLENTRIAKKGNNFLFAKKISATGKFNNLLFQAGLICESLSKRNSHLLKNPKDAAYINAFVLGDKTGLDKGTKTIFTRTGLSHLLSLSGLHMGILFLILGFVMKPIEKRGKVGKIITSTFLILFLCGFALLTGCCASIVRSAAMSCILIIGRMYNRKSMAINALAVSWMIQLIWKPLWLCDASFLLSYIALIGLVILGGTISSSIEGKSGIINKISSLFSATLAAQFFTLPVSMYFFGQFPVWFLFANMIAIPVSTIITGLGFILLPVLYIPYLNEICAKILSYLILILESSASFFSTLPFAVLECGTFNIQQSICCGVLILAVTYWITYSLRPRIAEQF